MRRPPISPGWLAFGIALFLANLTAVFVRYPVTRESVEARLDALTRDWVATRPPDTHISQRRQSIEIAIGADQPVRVFVERDGGDSRPVATSHGFAITVSGDDPAGYAAARRLLADINANTAWWIDAFDLPDLGGDRWYTQAWNRAAPWFSGLTAALLCLWVLPLVERRRVVSANTWGWRSHAKALAPILLVAALLRTLPVLWGSFPLERDEPFAVGSVLSVSSWGWDDMPNNPPVYYLLLKALYRWRLVEAETVDIRMVSAIAGVAAVAAVYAAATSLLGAEAAVIAGALFACNALSLNMSHLARAYSLGILLLALALLALARATVTGRWVWWCVAGFAIGLAMLTHYSAVGWATFLVILSPLAAWIAPGLPWRGWMLSGVASLFLVAPITVEWSQGLAGKRDLYAGDSTQFIRWIDLQQLQEIVGFGSGLVAALWLALSLAGWRRIAGPARVMLLLTATQLALYVVLWKVGAGRARYGSLALPAQMAVYGALCLVPKHRTVRIGLVTVAVAISIVQTIRYFRGDVFPFV